MDNFPNLAVLFANFNSIILTIAMGLVANGVTPHL